MTHDDQAYIDEVDAALADLALSAVATLRIEMHQARNSKDKIAAANSILDRLGYGRTTRAQAEVADREIRNALVAAQKTASKVSSRELGSAPRVEDIPGPVNVQEIPASSYPQGQEHDD